VVLVSPKIIPLYLIRPFEPLSGCQNSSIAPKKSDRSNSRFSTNFISRDKVSLWGSGLCDFGHICLIFASYYADDNI
jgi:hypothetical protein